jgi:hypothetical protein
MFGVFEDFRGRRRIAELSRQLEEERKIGDAAHQALTDEMGVSHDLRLIVEGTFRFLEWGEKHRGLPRSGRGFWKARLAQVGQLDREDEELRRQAAEELL